MNSQIQSIKIENLHPHPDNPNRMSKADLRKLIRNIERTGRYEPIIVRHRRPDARGQVRRKQFEILNGHHRCEALRQLGYTHADCVVWQVSNDEAALLLATLNRLHGHDVIDKKLALLDKLNRKHKVEELAKLLPNTGPQLQKLIDMHREKLKLRAVELNCDELATPMVFFLSKEQKAVVDEAVDSIQTNAKTKAARNAEAITMIAKKYMEK